MVSAVTWGKPEKPDAEHFYEGWNVDAYAQGQTLTAKLRRNADVVFYHGYDEMRTDWRDMMPEFPLDVRFASFKRRLSKAIALQR